MAGRGWPIFAATVLVTSGTSQSEHRKAARINRQAHLTRSAADEHKQGHFTAVEAHLARAGVGEQEEVKEEEHLSGGGEVHLARTELVEEEKGHVSGAAEAHIASAAAFGEYARGHNSTAAKGDCFGKAEKACISDDVCAWEINGLSSGCKECVKRTWPCTWQREGTVCCRGKCTGGAMEQAGVCACEFPTASCKKDRDCCSGSCDQDSRQCSCGNENDECENRHQCCGDLMCVKKPDAAPVGKCR